MYILLISFFLCTIILFIPINIEIEYCRKGQDDNFELKLYAMLKIFAFGIKIPFLQNAFMDFMNRLFAEIDIIFMNFVLAKKEIELDKEINFNEVNTTQIKKLFNLFKKRKLPYLMISNMNIYCKKFSWKTEYGFANPAVTGISNGFFWIIKGLILTLVNSLCEFKISPEIFLIPDFNQQKFHTSFSGIFSFRIGNIILTVMKLVIYKIKGGSRNWQNIQLKN